MRISDWSSDVCSSDLHSPALLLLADPQAQHPSGSPARCGDQRQPEVLPRHRLGTPCPARQGKCLRLCRLLYGVRGARTLCRGEIGRASCRERGGPDVTITVVGVSLKKKKKNKG